MLAQTISTQSTMSCLYKIDTRVTEMLRAALERVRQARLRSSTVEHQPLVPALAALLHARATRMTSSREKWAVVAKECQKTPLEYMTLCRKYLKKLDTKGWNRSYHQRLFHDDFLKACTRSFWKLEPPGQFARDHQTILRMNGWDHIAQEILISTPLRFGKTISVSMFCAAIWTLDLFIIAM
jgi:hypothetical protein